MNFLFIIAAMLSIGLRVTGGEIVAVLKDTRLMAKVFLANLVLVPLLGLLIVKVFTLNVDCQVGILLLALAPGGGNAIQFTGQD